MHTNPDILLIVTDQMRMDLLRCYHPDTPCRTPNLDRLAGDALVFDNHYTACAVCTPARASLQTGLLPSGHGMLTNSYSDGCSVHELEDTPELLSRRLLAAGYSAGYTGKWHLGGVFPPPSRETGRWPDYARGRPTVLPSTVGYEGDDFPGHGSGGYRYPQYLRYLRDHGLELRIENSFSERPWHTQWGEIAGPPETTVEHFLTDRTIALVKRFRERGRPFCMQLNFWGPHEPFYAPGRFLDEYRNVRIPEPAGFREKQDGKPKHHGVWRRTGKDWPFFEQALRHYWACMTSIDFEIGRLFAYLDDAGAYENTVIVFTCDHGDSQGCHAGIENKGLHMYEEIMHIPLLIKPAGPRTGPGRVRALTGTCDVYATILRLAEPDRPPCERHGKSLTAFMNGGTDGGRHDRVVSEGHGLAGVLFSQRMIRMGDWKYIFNVSGADELYDLAADPRELRNRSDDPECRDTQTRLRRALLESMESTGDALRHAFRNLAPR